MRDFDYKLVIRNRFKRLGKRWKLALGFVIFLFILSNALAFMHARAMTHFGPRGPQPLRPQDMSVSQKLRTLCIGVRIPRPTNAFTPDKYDLPFETHHLLSTDGVNLEAWHIPRENSRGLILLFHGYQNCKAGELREAKVFHDLGFETMLIDFHGSGGSSGNETTVGYREADDVAAAVTFARDTFHPARLVLYGQSMGSAAILRAMSMDDLKPDAIIVECPYDRLLDTVANRFTSMGLPSFPCARMLLFWGSVQEGYWAFGMNPVDYASHVSCPALYFRGADDPWVTKSEAGAVFERVTGPKTLIEIEHAGHEGCFPRGPEEWTAAVKTFLGER